MRRDLDGLVGHLDALAPDLVVDDDIYGVDRLTAGTAAKQLGALSDVDREHSAQFQWWNSETQSNWRDGWLRHLLLVGDSDEQAAGTAYVRRMLATADPDGYLGIHAPGLRFPRSGEQGELWAQATLGRALLAYVEAGPDAALAARALRALRASLAVTMAAWPRGGPPPFPDDGYAGASHGLMLTDVLDRVADLVEEPELRSYAAWLYAGYSGSGASEPDAQLPRLLDPAGRFAGHGVHTYEHLRALLVALGQDSTGVLATALDSYLGRLRQCLTPAFGPIGDEWIGGRIADPSTTGYELCSIQELLDSLLRLVERTDDLRWADLAEQVLLNAGLGAWHPHLPAVAYLQTDDQVAMTGNRADLPADPHQTRYRYSPVHRQAAVCCVPNAGRLLPTLLGGSVLRRGRDVVLALPGPLVTELDVDAVPVRIEVDTTWPQSLELRVTVTAARPVAFALEIRRPAWAAGMTAVARGLRGDRPPVVVEGERGDRIVLRGTWCRHEAHVVVDATAQVRRTGARAYVVHGPRVLALPIPSRTTVTREHLPGFVDVIEEPTDEEHARLHLLADRPDLLRVVPDGVEAPFRRLGQGRREDQVVLRTLRPLGTSALRRVTFPVGTPMPGPRGERPREADPGLPGPAA